jgi:hypothetical protein
MKKLLLYAFTLILSTSWAQLKDIEVIAGPNQSTLRSSVVNPISGSKSNFESKMGFSAGVGSNYYFNDKFSITAQVLYQRTAIHGDFQSEWSNYRGVMQQTTSFEHISLPVRARYTVGNKVKFTGEFGGFVNYLINATASDYPVYDESQTPNYEAINEMNSNFAKASEDSYTRLDAGLSLGFSSHVSLNEKLGIKLSVSDNYGLANISKLEYLFLPMRNSYYIRTNTMNLLAGVVYSLR